MKSDDSHKEPRMLISVKTLAGYLPTIQLKHDATVADLADAVFSCDPDAYRDCRPVFIRAHANGGSEELEEESRQLSSFGLQCEVEEELVMWVENISDLSRYQTNDIEELKRLLKRGGRYVNTLKLGFTKFSDALCCAMAPTMILLTSVKELNLSYNDIGDAGIQIIASGLKNMKSMTHLDLSNNKFGDDGTREVASALKELNSMTHLDLHDNKIKKSGGLALAAALNSIPDLKYLNVGHNKLGNAGVRALISAMPPMVNLTYLNLMRTGFDEISCNSLKAVLPALVSLQLDFCRVRFPKLTTNMIALESLMHGEIEAECSGSQKINDDGIRTLAASLMNFESLHSLVLSSIQLDDGRYRTLVPVFSTLKALRRLTLRNVCRHGDGGHRELANVFETLESLEYLNLSRNPMLDFTALVPSMSKLTSLTYLHLSDNRIDADNCRSLVHVLSELPSLENLNLQRNEIDNEGCRALASELPSLKSLNRLDLVENQYDVDACHAIIAAIMQSHKSLMSLRLGKRHQPISKETCRQLIPALKLVQYWSVFGHSSSEGKGCEICKHEYEPNDQKSID